MTTPIMRKQSYHEYPDSNCYNESTEIPDQSKQDFFQRPYISTDLDSDMTEIQAQIETLKLDDFNPN